VALRPQTTTPRGESLFTAAYRSVAQNGAKPRMAFLTPSLEIDKGIGGPKFRTQLLAGNELAGRAEKRGKHLQGTPLNRQRIPERRSSTVFKSSSKAAKRTV
jgi:hypothetical protein